eukprot:scaffold6180_cov200-Pinguiococcus_pyrenoidosus.AAC.7
MENLGRRSTSNPFGLASPLAPIPAGRRRREDEAGSDRAEKELTFLRLSLACSTQSLCRDDGEHAMHEATSSPQAIARKGPS